MQSNATHFYSRQGLGLKLALIPLVFILAMITMILYVNYAQQARRFDADMLDMIGRQRTLNQLYQKALLLENLAEKNDAAYWRDTFNDTLDALLNGGTALVYLRQDERITLPPAPTPEIAESLRKQRSLMQEITSQEARFLQLRPGSPEYSTQVQTFRALSENLHFAINETVRLYTDYSNAKLRELSVNLTLLGLGVMALGLLLNWLIARSISRPVLALAQQARQVAAGQLNTPPLPVKSQDEIGQLTEAFNQMTLDLRDMTQQSLEGIRNLTASAAEILASTQQQNAATQEQVTAIQQTTATMEEIRQSGSQITERAQEVAVEAGTTSELSENGLHSVQETLGLMDNIQGQIYDLAENMVGLSEHNRAVGEIIALVTDLADQTNLLALNAAIEAAAAGEQGQSFAVVASEMKHLSQQAKHATVQVRGILEQIQKGIAKAVMLTEESVKRVETGREQTGISEHTIRQLADTTQQSIQTFQQIVAATNQQQLGLEQVFQALQDIRQSAQQHASSTSQLNQAANNLTALGQQLQQRVARYSL